MRLIFLGPPGAGKGTQAELVSAKLSVPQISTGDILRDAVRRQTDLGAKAKAHMDSGGLVPDEIMLSLVERRLAEPDCAGGFLLDGYPRTLSQAEGLDRVLAGGKGLDAVVLIEVDDDEVVSRLAQRRVCPQCKALYNLDGNPPRTEGVCDQCGGALVTRSDDAEQTVRTRLEVYRRQTLPLVEYYSKKGILKRVKSEGGIQKVFDAIIDALEKP